ncbi:MAG: hypothetical protein EA376_06755 [Phycisphaeraceae bacterium]|nr:MAG: hypothetical protein EA376_06755 [Phycisphaeraceae bacterium]
MRLSQILHTPLAIAITLGAIALLLCGCSLNRPYQEKERFGLNLGDVQRASTTHAGALAVERVRIAAPFSGHQFVYRTGDERYRVDYFNEFVTPPEALLSGALERALADARIHETIVGPGSRVEQIRRLETSVTYLAGDVSVQGEPRAVVRARFLLIDESGAAPAVVGDWVFQASEPMPSATPEELAAAFGRAFTDIANRLIRAMDRGYAESYSSISAIPERTAHE